MKGVPAFIKGSGTIPRLPDTVRSQMRSHSASIFPGGVGRAGFVAAFLGEEGLLESTCAAHAPLLTPPARHKTSLLLSGLQMRCRPWSGAKFYLGTVRRECSKSLQALCSKGCLAHGCFRWKWDRSRGCSRSLRSPGSWNFWESPSPGGFTSGLVL